MVPTRQGTLLGIVLIVLVDRVEALVQTASTVIEVAIFYDVLKANPKTYGLLVALDFVDGEDHGSVDWIEWRFQQTNRVASDSTDPGHALLAIRKREVGVALPFSAELTHEVFRLSNRKTRKGGG